MFLVENFIQKYTYLVNEYLEYMLQSETLCLLNHSTYITCIGLNTILHIFNLTLSITKDLEQSLQYCQKAYCWYLEYIEQMHKTNLLHNLDNLDAITFVYKKIMEELQPLNAEINLSSMLQLTNINSIIEPYDQREERESIENKWVMIEDLKERNVLIHQSFLLTKVLLFMVKEFHLDLKDEKIDFHFTIQQMKEISDRHLWNFFILFYPEKNHLYDYRIIIRYIHFIQDKLQMEFEEYSVFLSETRKNIKKLKSKRIFPSENQIQNKILDFFYNEENLKKINNLKETKKISCFTKRLFDFSDENN
jgi:hypothetical protein